MQPQESQESYTVRTRPRGVTSRASELPLAAACPTKAAVSVPGNVPISRHSEQKWKVTATVVFTRTKGGSARGRAPWTTRSRRPPPRRCSNRRRPRGVRAPRRLPEEAEASHDVQAPRGPVAAAARGRCRGAGEPSSPTAGTSAARRRPRGPRGPAPACRRRRAPDDAATKSRPVLLGRADGVDNKTARLLGNGRSARPTCCTNKAVDCVGRTNMTALNDGSSKPSANNDAFATTSTIPSLSSANVRFLSFSDVLPSRCSARTPAPRRTSTSSRDRRMSRQNATAVFAPACRARSRAVSPSSPRSRPRRGPGLPRDLEPSTRLVWGRQRFYGPAPGPPAARRRREGEPSTASLANRKGVAVRPSTLADALDFRPAKSDRYESAAPWCASS